MKIVRWPHTDLSKIAEPVKEFDNYLSSLVSKMTQLMDVEKGIGLAAPQVGISKRVIIVRAAPVQAQLPLVLVNPEILFASTTTNSIREGCLSFPKTSQRVSRPTSITVRYQTLTGEILTQEFSGIESRCIQHEIDHLDGITLVDYMTQLKKRKYTRGIK